MKMRNINSSQEILERVRRIVVQLNEERPRSMVFFNRIFSFALEHLQPRVHWRTGLRLKKINSQQAEIILEPIGEALRLEQMTRASEQIWTWLWHLHVEGDECKSQVKEIKLQLSGPLNGKVYTRAHLDQVERETTLLELQKFSKAHFVGRVQFFDSNEKLVAESEIEMILSQRAEIGWAGN